MPRPSDPLLSGWHAVKCLREWRGDTHWALIVANGLTHPEASILHNAWLGYEPDWLALSRGTSAEDIEAGWTALHNRGLAAGRESDTRGFSSASTSRTSPISARRCRGSCWESGGRPNSPTVSSHPVGCSWKESTRRPVPITSRPPASVHVSPRPEPWCNSARRRSAGGARHDSRGMPPRSGREVRGHRPGRAVRVR